MRRKCLTRLPMQPLKPLRFNEDSSRWRLIFVNQQQSPVSLTANYGRLPVVDNLSLVVRKSADVEVAEKGDAPVEQIADPVIFVPHVDRLFSPVLEHGYGATAGLIHGEKRGDAQSTPRATWLGESP